MERTKKPTIAISGCLLGENIRYNNSHTRDKWIVNELSKYVNFVSFCPEMQMGLGVPREELALIYNEDNSYHLEGKRSKKVYKKELVDTFKDLNLKFLMSDIDGFILMRKSPSCGIDNANATFESDRTKTKKVSGVFAREIQQNFPLTPKEDSGRLNNLELREAFIRKVFAHLHLKEAKSSISEIQNFHKKYKYLIMEHSQSNLKKLGQIAANSQNYSAAIVYHQYKKLFFETLELPLSRNNRYNTLLHIMGYLKTYLCSDDKRSLLEHFNEYKLGDTGYESVLRLVKFFIKKYDVAYFTDTFYFEPFPKSIKLAT